ncbi:MAG: FKBP-type peptidyl-prolyl cis-trans isomerase [Bacteroidota bacterium]
MRTFGFFSIVAAAALLISCNSEETPYGLTFTRHRAGNAPLVKDGEYLVMNLVAIDEHDSVWHDTYKQDQPMIIRVSPLLLPGLKEPGETGVYRMLHKGDSVSFDLDAETIYVKTWNQDLPRGMEPDLRVSYHLAVVDVVDEAGLEQYQLRNLERYEAKRLENQIRQYGIDTVLIADYLKKNSIVARKTLSGLHYVVVKEGSGSLAIPGNKVSVRYSGKLLDGKEFDSNLLDGAPMVVNVGKGDVIPGWEEALQLVKKGGRYTFYIPSLFGYAEKGSNRVPSNAILVFDLEVTDIQP